MAIGHQWEQNGQIGHQEGLKLVTKIFRIQHRCNLVFVLTGFQTRNSKFRMVTIFARLFLMVIFEDQPVKDENIICIFKG